MKTLFFDHITTISKHLKHPFEKFASLRLHGKIKAFVLVPFFSCVPNSETTCVIPNWLYYFQSKLCH